MERGLLKLWPVAVVVVGVLIQAAQAEVRLRVLESSFANHVEKVDGDLGGLRVLMLRICDKVVGGPECRL